MRRWGRNRAAHPADRRPQVLAIHWAPDDRLRFTRLAGSGSAGCPECHVQTRTVTVRNKSDGELTASAVPCCCRHAALKIKKA
jgi:hypothetical protein